MMVTRCPNCDQPLRDGAKFCTSCGYRLEIAEPTTPPVETPPPAVPTPMRQPQQAQRLKGRIEEVDAEDVSCPHCGKRNRQGVKFCRYCGGNLALSAGVPQSRSRIVTVSFLVLVILMICVSLVGIGWGLGVDQWLFPTATPGASNFPFLGILGI